MNKFSNRGFTLIEILIALIIIGLTLTAVFWALIQHSAATQHLQDKTYAHWAGMNAINQYQIKYANDKKRPRELNGEEIVYAKQWEWTLLVKDTPDPHVLELEVSVRKAAKKQPIIHLYGYMAQL